MEINLKKAIKEFYPISSSSLEMVYYEAVANAIDAGATEIIIDIEIESYNKHETLAITIEDNGKGFTDENFLKFSRLLETDQAFHKGLGRLVYLHYFKNIEVVSFYENKKRTFEFNDTFSGDKTDEDSLESEQQTCLSFKNYQLSKIKEYDYIKPPKIIEFLKIHFYPQFYAFKIDSRPLKISVKLSTDENNEKYDFFSMTSEFNISELPDLEMTTFKVKGIDLYKGDMTLRYFVQQNDKNKEIITAVSADNRTIRLELLKSSNLPEGYEAFFLLYSDFFNGKANFSRNKLDLEPNDKNLIEADYIKAISDILIAKIPSMVEKNQLVKKDLIDRYPHLQGYFNSKTVGLMSRESTLDAAQKQFFKEQKEILDATSLNDDQFQKSMEISSRLLTEYILYRNIIIRKLEEMNFNNAEADIHDIIVPMQKALRKENFIQDMYNNNAWLLDDKYMSYTTILSDKKMSALLREISLDGENSADENGRPDIAIVFSGDPDLAVSAKIDVVIVELKKRGIPLVKNAEVILQLRDRARKLLAYYPNKIQRIWFYGIVDIDEEFQRLLIEDGYHSLFSLDQVFYREYPFQPDLKINVIIPTAIYILSFDAFLKDAETRNSTFLKILKEGLKRGTETN